MLSRRGFLAGVLVGTRAAIANLTAAADGPGRPAEILIIRHAEKPEPEPDVHLNDRGRARAEALPGLFTSRFARPEFLFAAAQSKFSNHSYETIAPLARALDLPIDNHLPDQKYRALAKLILTDPRYRGKRVLICWHHESIPRLARALGATDAPTKWRDKVYDRVWRLRYSGERVAFENLPQQLLPGDSGSA